MTELHDASAHKEGTMRTLLVAFGLATGFLLWGIILFYTVGDKGPPAFDYGEVPDVPGLSVYSTDTSRPLRNVPPYFLHEQAGLSPQHVKDRPYILESKPLPAPETLPPTPQSQTKEPSP